MVPGELHCAAAQRERAADAAVSAGGGGEAAGEAVVGRRTSESMGIEKLQRGSEYRSIKSGRHFNTVELPIGEDGARLRHSSD